MELAGSGDPDVGGLRTRVSGEIGGGNVVGIGSVGNGQTAKLLVQVAWGPGFTRVTTFTLAVQRGAGCPVRFWASAVTAG